MCTDCMVSKENVEGEATEKAIVEAALKIGKNKNDINKKLQRVNEVGFDSKRKLMTTIHKKNDKYLCITKGAPDVLLKKCNKIIINENLKLLDNVSKINIVKENENMANNALRVIAVAYKELNTLPSKIDESIMM